MIKVIDRRKPIDKRLRYQLHKEVRLMRRFAKGTLEHDEHRRRAKRMLAALEEGKETK